MLTFLRVIGLLNAAVWFGASVFFTFVIGPSVFSPEVKRIFEGVGAYRDYYPGVIAQIFIGRYFVFHVVCGLIAVAHFAGEFTLARRGFQKWLFLFLAAPLALGLLGGLVIQPKLRELHKAKWSIPDKVQRDASAAATSFSKLHAVSQTLNLLTMVLLGAYLWRAANPQEPARFVSSQKFRG